MGFSSVSVMGAALGTGAEPAAYGASGLGTMVRVA